MLPMHWQLPFIMRLKINKREKFVIATLFLTLGLLISQYLFAQPRIILVVILSLLSTVFLFLILYSDIKGTSLVSKMGLLAPPVLYTLAFGFFYFLLPARFLTRILLSSFFAIGIYALYLSLNIYAVAGIRTIQLLNAARSVGFLLTVLTHFFLINVIFSLHLIFPLIFLTVFLLSLALIFHVIWSVNLEGSVTKSVAIFTSILALVIAELSLVLSFWPTTPTVAALFLSGNFYTFVGLSQAWMERRLFKNTLWEYIGVAIIVFLVLITRTQWGG